MAQYKNRFKLLSGKHIEKREDGTREVFSAKDPERNVVSTDRDLDEMFDKVKFRRLSRTRSRRRVRDEEEE